MSKTTALSLGLVATLAISAPALAATCGVGTFATTSYGATGFSCTIDDKVFADFSYVQNTSNAPAAGAVTITPVGPLGNEEGFIFSAAWVLTNTATSGVISLDSLWTYTVSTLSGRPLITDAIHSITGTNFGSGGLGAVSDTLLLGGGGSVTLDVNVAGPKAVGPVFFGPVSSLLVTKDLAELAAPGQSVSISADTQLFSQMPIPEPASLALIGVGLAGLISVRRRRR